MAIKYALEVRDVSHTFQCGLLDQVVLKNVSFRVKPGEVLAIVGPSGSGKSTLLHIAGLLSTPISGDVIVNTREIRNLSEAKKTFLRRKYIGFVYQFHHLMPEFTALENLMIPQFIHGISNKVAKEVASASLDKIGLAHKADSMVSDLSGGEQQRVAVARSFVTMPTIILADEPTGNLDQENASHIFSLFLGYAKKHRGAVVIVTHNMELAQKANRILSLEYGALIPL